MPKDTERPLRGFLFYCGFFCLLLLTLFLFGCENREPKIQNIYSRIIFDETSAGSVPKLHFSVFIKVSANASTITGLKVTSPSGNYVWQTDNPAFYSDDSKNTVYAGYSNFQFPDSTSIESGKYSVDVFTVSGKTETISFTWPVITAEMPELDSDHNSYIICSQDDTILYAGKKTPEFQSDSMLLTVYPEADYYRPYSTNSGSGAVYLYSPHFLEKE